MAMSVMSVSVTAQAAPESGPSCKAKPQTAPTMTRAPKQTHCPLRSWRVPSASLAAEAATIPKT